jgi:DNA-binding HxlR family transcriptional regulator
MLTQHLRDLEHERIIEKTVYPAVPPKVEYSLSEYGKTLTPVAEVMCAWGESHQNAKNRHFKAGSSACLGRKTLFVSSGNIR